MKRVLLISYFFPPLGGAGVQRSVKLVKLLPGLGYEVIVLTGESSRPDRWTPIDASLSVDVPEGTEIRRATGPEPSPLLGVRGRASRWLGRPSAFARWWPDAALAAATGIDSIDVVLATMSPFESARTARRLSRLLAVPWVADLRDPWALDEMIVYPTRFHRTAAQRTMREALASAAAIVMNTDEARSRLLERFPQLGDRPVAVVPNGYDGEDFAAPPPERHDAAFRIVHAGYLHTELGRAQRRSGRVRALLGGAVSGVDILSRSHVYLLDAIDRLKASDPDLGASIEVVLAGVLSGADVEAIGERSYVRRLGYVSHSETVGLMRSAELLFLPMHDLPPGLRATIVPGKTYEYLAAGPPILAAVPDGDARDLLTAAGNAWIVRPRDVYGMAGVLRSAIRSWQKRLPLSASADRTIVSQYERSRLVGDLAQVLDDVVSQQPFDAGTTSGTGSPL